MSMSAESVVGQDSHGEDELVVVAPLPLVEQPQEENETSDTGILNGVLNGMGALSVSECVQLSQEKIGALKTEELRDLVSRMQILMVADTDNKTQLNVTLLDLRKAIEEMTNYLKEEKLTTKSALNDIIQWKDLIKVKDQVIKVYDHVIKVKEQLIEAYDQARRNIAEVIRVKNDLIAIQNSEIKDLQQKLKLYEMQKLQQVSRASRHSPKIVRTRRSRLTRFAQNVSTKIKNIFKTDF